jgi:tellurite resistance-related uncharacterized protein
MGTQLPAGLTAYKRTPVFDQDTLPAGLRRQHRTRPGVWGVIHVLDGRLLYRVLEPPAETILLPGTPGIVQPQQPHEVEPLGPMRMFVEFHARDGDAPPPHDQVRPRP